MGKFINTLKIIGLLLFRRAVPALTLAILFSIVAVQIDRWRINDAPASNYINYTAFDVQNARAGEDVYFKVCRDHIENYTYAGQLTVYVYRDADPKTTPTKVFGKDIGGSIRTNCENKVLRAADFRHEPGTYKMAFCVDFNVKYNIKKTACKESNIYKIYPQPTDIQSQLKYYQDQIDILNTQLNDRGSDSPNSLQSNTGGVAGPNSAIGTPGSNTAPQAPITTPNGQTAGNGSNAGSGSTQTPPPAAQCAVNLGIGLFCGDGLIRL